MNDQEDKEWVKSDEARKALQVSSCDLSHLRTEGKLKYKKKGNAFLYLVEDVKRVAKKTQT